MLCREFYAIVPILPHPVMKHLPLILLLLTLWAFTTTTPASPFVKEDASIQWEDAHFQAKPDGNLMYLVTKGGVLIESSKFFIEAPDGSRHANLLPWEMRMELDGKGFSFGEPVRVRGASGTYHVRTTITSERSLRIQSNFEVEGYRALNTVLNLPLETFSGDSFSVDGESFNFTEASGHPDGQRVKALVTRRPFKVFVASGEKERRFVLQAESGLEIEVQNRADWKGHRSFWITLHSGDGQTVDYTIQLPEPEPAASARQEEKNLLANSSFELGREEWGVIFGKRDVSSRWSVTRETASHGDYSLKVEIVPPVAAFENPAKGATIASEYFQAQPLQRLTISADLKASVPGQTVKLQLRLVPTELVPNKGSTQIEKEVTLTNEWQRFSFDARLPLAANNAYAIAVEVPDTREAATVYLDAVTVAGSGITTYQPMREVEALTDTRRYRRLYVPGEPFDLVTSLRNDGREPVDGGAFLTIRNHLGEILHEERQELGVIEAGANARHFWKAPAFKRQGMYRVEVEAGPEDATPQVHTLSLGVVRDRQADEADPSNRFGACITDLREFWALERIGFGWSRFTFDCAWNNLQPSKNWWNQRKEAQLSALLDYQATFGVTPLAVLGPGIPKWASRAPEGSSAFRTYTPRDDRKDDFVEYLNRLLEMADGRLHAIETWNEPDIPLFYRGTVEEMADFTTLAYTVIKEFDPDIQVVGLGLATPAETKNEFLEELLSHTGLEPYDAISFHPYTEGRRHPARGEFREVVRSIGEVMTKFGQPVPLWSTEFGYFGYAQDAKRFVPYKNPFVAREILEEQESAEAYIQAICTSFANGVEKAFYFTLLEGDLLDRWLHGWVGPGGRSVESGFIAAAAACDLMEAVECLGQEELEEGVYQTRFTGPQGDFVVLWSEKGDTPLGIPSDAAVKAVDLYGNPFTISPDQGRVGITATESPVYLFIDDMRKERK
jgi:hypothetical protein